MKLTGHIEIMFEYDDSDICPNDGEPYITKATLNGYDTELHQDILEIINDDAMCQNQFENDLNDKAQLDAEDRADWLYHSRKDRHAEVFGGLRRIRG